MVRKSLPVQYIGLGVGVDATVTAERHQGATSRVHISPTRMADLTNSSHSQRTRFNYSPSEDIRSKNGRRKYDRKQRRLMKDNPETVLYDYKYDCIDNSDVYTLDENPCNAIFFHGTPC